MGPAQLQPPQVAFPMGRQRTPPPGQLLGSVKQEPVAQWVCVWGAPFGSGREGLLCPGKHWILLPSLHPYGIKLVAGLPSDLPGFVTVVTRDNTLKAGPYSRETILGSGGGT